MTKAAREFVTPLSLASLSEDKVYSELWSLTDESEMGHIRLSREADLVVVAPATADLIARMAAGLADDLAARSEEHTSELQSQSNLVCRLLLEKKKSPRSHPIRW